MQDKCFFSNRGYNQVMNPLGLYIGIDLKHLGNCKSAHKASLQLAEKITTRESGNT